MLIGITGGIGSGKSVIAQELARRGYKVYDSDAEAKRIIAQHREVQAQIRALLGEQSFVDGRYNTSYVAQRVFADEQLLQQLNAIVHPAVREEISAISRQSSGYFFVESAILHEAGLDRLCDCIIYVDAPEDVRIARTVARDHCEAAQVRARMSHQQGQTCVCHQPSEQKKTIVLRNDGSQSIEALVDWLISLL